MNAAASNLINGLYALLGTNAPLEKLRETRRLLADEIENMARRGEEVVLVSRYAAQFDKDFKAVFGDETSITEAKLSASPDQPGYAPDARVIARDPDPAPQGGNAGDAIPPQFLKGKGKDKDEDEDEDEDKDDEKKKKKAKADEAARRLYSRGVLRSPESSPRVTVTRETPEYMRHVEGILAAADDYRATASGYHLTPRIDRKSVV